MNNNQPQSIIVLPPYHEQSAPTFHVERSCADEFLEFLKTKGMETFEPPETIEKHGPDNQDLVEIKVAIETPVEDLEKWIEEFQARQGSQ